MKMRTDMVLIYYIVLVVMVVECQSIVNSVSTKQCPNIKTPFSFSRKRRHLVFPDNTDVIMTTALVKAFMTHAPSGWNIVLESDVLFPLPDAKFIDAQSRKKLHHRQKRELWERLQSAMDVYNINGRDCILRSICEAKMSLAPPGRSLVHDILRTLFRVPLEDEEFKNEIKDTYIELTQPNFCDKTYDCSFSVVDFVLALNRQ